MMADQMGACPFQASKAPSNPFSALANEYVANGCYPVAWGFNYTTLSMTGVPLWSTLWVSLRSRRRQLGRCGDRLRGRLGYPVQQRYRQRLSYGFNHIRTGGGRFRPPPLLLCDGVRCPSNALRRRAFAVTKLRRTGVV